VVIRHKLHRQGEQCLMLIVIVIVLNGYFWCCRTVNAMLNSSTGGTIYIGVSDDGVVHGVLLSQYKVYYFISCKNSVLSVVDTAAIVWLCLEYWNITSS